MRARPPTARHVGPVADAPIRLLRMGDGWCAVNKPANMLCHRNENLAKGESVFVLDGVRELVRERLGRDVEVRIVHRLDRATSGVMLFAVGDSASAARLQAALQETSVAQKQYWTIARCLPGALPEGRTWTNDNPLHNLSKSKSSEPQHALTHFTNLLRLTCDEEWLGNDRGEDSGDAPFFPHEIAVLNAVLGTGRRHQIRRHLSNSKCPILADTSYSRGKYNRDARRRYGVSRLALHARRITFRDPSPNASPDDEKAIVTVESPVPDDLRTVLKRVPGFDMALHGEMCDIALSEE